MKEKREKNRWELNVEIKDRNECLSFSYVSYTTAIILVLLSDYEIWNMYFDTLKYLGKHWRQWAASQILDFFGYEAWGKRVLDAVETLLTEKRALTPDLGIPLQFEKIHVGPPSSQDEALSRYSVSGEVPR